MKQIEQLFERALWSSRFIVIIPVVASALIAIGLFLLTTYDVVALLGQIGIYVNPALADDVRSKLRLETLSLVVSVVDGYLLAAIMLIFSLGLYELFVNKINVAEGSEFAARLLLIRSMDDLKDRLAKVVLLILIVKFFQQALKLKYESVTDLLMLSMGVILVSGALYLSHLGGKSHSEHANHPPDQVKS
jgi:uncharacterized membrane protein YqhA